MRYLIYILGSIAGFIGISLIVGRLDWPNLTHWQYWVGATLVWVGYGEAYRVWNYYDSPKS